MKRIWGWNDSRWPIPRPLQVLAGMVPARDPEAYRDRQTAAQEAAAERAAIQWESRGCVEIEASAPAAAAAKPAKGASDVEAEPPAWGDELPVRAQPGWYRLGRSFYRVGQGPFAHWGFPEPAREPARYQGTLF